jgi:pilus assembly protein CpaF
VIRRVVDPIPPPDHGRRLAEVLADVPTTSPSQLAERIRSVDPLLDLASVARTVGRALARSGGFGPLDAHLDDPAVTEIMINGPGPVWLDRNGRLQPVGYIDGDDIGLIIERILDPLGLRVDRSAPFVDARLADGSRANIVVPPLAVDGPVVTIRRFSTRTIGLADFGHPTAVDLLARRLAARDTILVVGGTGAGKTTLLNALGGRLDPSERIVTIEDTAELHLPGRHVVRLEARPPNSEGVGAVELRTLVRNALRMRPDRIVVGEVRGPEALDLILALSAGHDGSLATCHAASCEGGLRRLETLALLDGADLSPLAVRSQLVDAVDLVVRVTRSDGRRRITDIVSVAGDDGRMELSSLWTQS